MGKMMMLAAQDKGLERLPTLPMPGPEILSDVGELFLHLTSWTVPYGGEFIYYHELLSGLGFVQDAHGNWVTSIPHPDGEAASYCFMSHLDTCGGSAEPITREVADDYCKSVGGAVLGADDRAGVSLICHLVSQDYPGYYYLFVGEEKGCVGSGKAADERLLPARITKCISFDRYGYEDIITHQCGQRTCSDAFAEALAGQFNAMLFNYSPDRGGLYTDSNEFAGRIPECTNISVGYEGHHTSKERQDLRFLRYLASAMPSIDWEGLPVERDPGADDWDADLLSRWDEGDDAHFTRGDDGVYRLSDQRDYREYDDGKSYFSQSAEDDAYDAINSIISDFKCGFSPSMSDINDLIQRRKEDTAGMLELLIIELLRIHHDRTGDG